MAGSATQEVEGLWEAVKGVGLASSNFQLHLGSRAINIRAKGVPGQESQPSVLINRGVLCGTMLEHLVRPARCTILQHHWAHTRVALAFEQGGGWRR